ncbi:MAG: MFS transporter [Pseudomonadota bacterium]
MTSSSAMQGPSAPIVETRAAAPTGFVRWRLAWVLMATLFVGYLDRVNISLALPLIAVEKGWSDAEMKSYGELLFSAFYVGYGLANIFLSPLAARFGPRRSLIAIVILWALFTAVGAVASQVMLAFVAARILLGLSEGVHFPMMNMLTRNWFPQHERGRANSIWISGLFLAVLLSPAMLVPAMTAFGWRTGFWGLAAFGLVVTLPLVIRYVRDEPARSPDLSDAERRYIAETLDGDPDEDAAAAEGFAARARRLFSDPTFALLLCAGILNNIVALGLVSWLPSFFVRVKGLPYESLAWAAALPYAASLIGIALWSNIGDRLSRRALIASIGYLLAGAGVYLSLTSDSIALVLAFFSGAIFLSSSYVAAEFALLQKALPRATVGGDTGLYNGLSTLIGGGLGPIVVSSIIGDPDAAGSVERLLIVPAVCALVAGVLFTTHKRLGY